MRRLLFILNELRYLNVWSQLISLRRNVKACRQNVLRGVEAVFRPPLFIEFGIGIVGPRSFYAKLQEEIAEDVVTKGSSHTDHVARQAERSIVVFAHDVGVGLGNKATTTQAKVGAQHVVLVS